MSIIANRHRTRVCENDRRKQAHKKHRLGAVGNTYHYGGKVACVAEGKGQKAIRQLVLINRLCAANSVCAATRAISGSVRRALRTRTTFGTSTTTVTSTTTTRVIRTACPSAFATMYDSTKYPAKTGEINVFAKGACNLSRKGQTKTPMWSIGRYLHCRLLRYIGLMVGITCNRNPQLYFDCTGFNFDL